MDQNQVPMPTSNTPFRYLFWIILGIAIGITNQAISHPRPFLQAYSVTPTFLPVTLEATLETRQDVGSTDGIVLVAVIIVLIVIIPILIRRKAWSTGGRKRKDAG
jgi:surface polysaccharide O-acyltransferase-like enzyme